MPLVYVTGISGSGKSAVLAELRTRGYEAYGVDEDAYGKWVKARSGDQSRFPLLDQEADVHAWYREHDWVLDVEKIARLRERSDEDNAFVFLCGVAAGDAEAWRYFRIVCALVVDDATIKERIALRDDVGKDAGELAQILKWNEGYEETYRRFGAAIVDATEPISLVVDRVLTATGA